MSSVPKHLDSTSWNRRLLRGSIVDSQRKLQETRFCSIYRILTENLFHIYHVVTILLAVSWSIACVVFLHVLGYFPQWSESAQGSDLRLIGTLFIFALVFRFNQCYNRWWMGRLAWGNIIQSSIELSQKASLWVTDEEFCTQVNRLVIGFAYACKSQLRGSSLSEQTDRQGLVERGILEKSEISYMRVNPCWEPYMLLDMLRGVLVNIMKKEYEKGGVLILPKSNKIHEKLFSPMDKTIERLGVEFGKLHTIRAAGMPPLYDTIHHGFFWLVFFIAPAVWAPQIGWTTVFLTFVLATMTLALTDFGTCLIDPFGKDATDLPLERYCQMIESQVMETTRRHASGDIQQLLACRQTSKNPFSKAQSCVLESRVVDYETTSQEKSSISNHQGVVDDTDNLAFP